MIVEIERKNSEDKDDDDNDDVDNKNLISREIEEKQENSDNAIEEIQEIENFRSKTRQRESAAQQEIIDQENIERQRKILLLDVDTLENEIQQYKIRIESKPSSKQYKKLYEPITEENLIDPERYFENNDEVDKLKQLKNPAEIARYFENQMAYEIRMWPKIESYEGMTRGLGFSNMSLSFFF